MSTKTIKIEDKSKKKEEKKEVDYIEYQVGTNNSNLYNVKSTQKKVSIRELTETQAIIELNTIMQLVQNKEGVGAVAMFLSLKNEMVTNSILSIIKNDKKGLIPETTKNDLLELFQAPEVPKEEVSDDKQEKTETVEKEEDSKEK